MWAHRYTGNSFTNSNVGDARHGKLLKTNKKQKANKKSWNASLSPKFIFHLWAAIYPPRQTLNYYSLIKRNLGNMQNMRLCLKTTLITGYFFVCWFPFLTGNSLGGLVTWRILRSFTGCGVSRNVFLVPVLQTHTRYVTKFWEKVVTGQWITRTHEMGFISRNGEEFLGVHCHSSYVHSWQFNGNRHTARHSVS